MAMLKSFKDSGSDEARDNEEDTEMCSHCATDGKLQPAFYFCYDCGVFGRYICGKCLIHHNRIVKSHKVEMISNQSMSRGQTLETDLAKERKEIEELRRKLDNSTKQIIGLEKELKEMYQTNLFLQEESIQLNQRVMKLSGKKLQEKNADTADLNDPNRALKLSEKFGQLYDDEWTNAFECLTDKKIGVPLKDAINVLLRLLQECWTFCNKLVAAQMESLQNVFLHPAQNLANFDQKKTGLTDRPRITSKDQPSLNDLRKRVGVSPPVIEEVKQALLADSKTWDKREKKEFDKKHIEACTPYLQTCAEVCWLMALHDPPLVMKMDVKQGEKIDTNIYTVYSQSGQTIDFLVWPPLYNGRDGGLLSKGVAEPVKVVSKKK
ncbi:uncharacterized protein LOC132757101 [Ruditapes philippinarum]|uniref:uncharacterized protein LOC132757101 n=1 Tax=Ruditapes philippinarum TaxID=129788 RepID=UPI00295B1E7A|nr:uncharacterized protein LOC132757101 [Ruditapes philippinarum]